MSSFSDLEKEINKIKERNVRVEADKDWETSWTRKFIIALVTYITIALFLYITNFGKPLVGAIIPTIGFLLSTFSVSILKSFWIKYFYKK